MNEASSNEGIVVLGAPRSGTTLVQRLLDAHNDVCCPPETYLLVAAGRYLAEERYAFGIRPGVISGLGFNGVDAEDVIAPLRELTLGHLRNLSADAGKRIWAEKTACNCFYVDAIERLLGDRVRYLLLFRNPLDVICSQKELADVMEGWLEELHSRIGGHPNPYVGLARAWIEVCDRMLRLESARPNRCVRLRYEDLVADPVGETGRVFSLFGLDGDPAVIVAEGLAGERKVGLGDWKIHETRNVHAKSVGRASSLSDETRALVSGIVGDMAVNLGYERPVVPKIPSDEEARRQYQLRRMVVRLRSASEPEDNGGP